MKAIVTVAFKGCPEGKIYPRAFEPGDVIEGSLAVSAVAGGLAKQISAKAAPAPKNKSQSPPKNKSAPKNKAAGDAAGN